MSKTSVSISPVLKQRAPRGSTNPKDQAAKAEGKVRLDLLEPAGNAACARALEFGAITKQYGIQNYVQVAISLRTYLAAMQRHLDDLKSGEDFAPDSGVHHIGHILANGHIWLAALEAGTAIDDRGPGPVGSHPLNHMGTVGPDVSQRLASIVGDDKVAE
jgi:hypothetical protein